MPWNLPLGARSGGAQASAEGETVAAQLPGISGFRDNA